MYNSRERRTMYLWVTCEGAVQIPNVMANSLTKTQAAEIRLILIAFGYQRLSHQTFNKTVGGLARLATYFTCSITINFIPSWGEQISCHIKHYPETLNYLLVSDLLCLLRSEASRYAVEHEHLSDCSMSPESISLRTVTNDSVRLCQCGVHLNSVDHYL